MMVLVYMIHLYVMAINIVHMVKMKQTVNISVLIIQTIVCFIVISKIFVLAHQNIFNVCQEVVCLC